MTPYQWLVQQGACPKGLRFVTRNGRIPENEVRAVEFLRRAWDIQHLDWILRRLAKSPSLDPLEQSILYEMQGFLRGYEAALRQERTNPYGPLLVVDKRRLRRAFLRAYSLTPLEARFNRVCQHAHQIR